MMFLRYEQTGRALREELKDIDPDYTDMYKCDECAVYFDELTTHEDKELGTIEVCESCLANIKQQENKQYERHF